MQALSGQEIDREASAAFVSDVAEGADAASSLEPSVRTSDALVDRLRRESDRVAKKSALLAQLHALERKAEAITQEAAEFDSRQERWRSEWSHAWKEASIQPTTPSEMRAWLRKHAELLAISNEFAAAAESLAADDRGIEALCTRLSVELLACGIQPPQGSGFDSLLTRATERVAEAEALQHEHSAFQAETNRLEEEIAVAEREAEIAQTELGAWQQEWNAALVPLRLDANALPEQAEAVLTNLDDLFRDLDSSDSYKARIWGIDKTAKEFTDAAVELSATIAPDLAAGQVAQIVATLNARLAAAKEAQQQAKSLEEQLLTERENLANAESDLAVSQAVLDVLLQEAGCESLAALPAAIANAAIRANLQSSLKELENQLLPFCAGKTLDEFNAEAESEDADRLQSAIDELESKITDLGLQRDEAIKSIEHLKGSLSQFAGAAAAAEKADERQFLLRQLEDDAREYAVATVASRLLRLAVERYREKSQGPVLAEASRYFAKLTCDAFRGLRSDYDDAGQEVLIGVRESSMPLPVEAMSEGTRDQLYLALRLGTLEHWFQRHEPIPFIVDDVLLTFDDERAAAALEALLELSKRTQVLLFTHHAHVASLARDVAKSTGADAQCNVVSDWNRPISA
ncbi:ATP-binding protein [Lacipirellula sp.]|uniref:ATP-binding protein n=1 Tax=Lacipirellula sp. TaxID=2691419 RepID=UPI003D116A59